MRKVLRGFLKTFVAGMANLDLSNPFGSEDLVRSKTAHRNRIQDRVNDVTALTLNIFQLKYCQQ